jgi:hypothetical protein
VTNRTTYAALAIGILVVFGVAITIGLFTEAEAGSMADWVAAVATVAAFGAAILAARYAAGAFELESGRDAQFLAVQRRSQAALVAAWPDKFIPHWDHHPDGTSTIVEGITGGIAMLRNASDVPVTNVHVDFTVILAHADGLAGAETRYLGGEDLAVLPPSTEPREIRWSIAPTAVMIPGVPTLGDGQDYPDHGTYDPARLMVDITFRDATGVLWHRDHAGRLTEVLETQQIT